MNDKETAESIGQARDMLARLNDELSKLERAGWRVSVSVGDNNRPTIDIERRRIEGHTI